MSSLGIYVLAREGGRLYQANLAFRERPQRKARGYAGQISLFLDWIYIPEGDLIWQILLFTHLSPISALFCRPILYRFFLDFHEFILFAFLRINICILFVFHCLYYESDWADGKKLIPCFVIIV